MNTLAGFLKEYPLTPNAKTALAEAFDSVEDLFDTFVNDMERIQNLPGIGPKTMEMLEEIMADYATKTGKDADNGEADFEPPADTTPAAYAESSNYPNDITPVEQYKVTPEQLREALAIYEQYKGYAGHKARLSRLDEPFPSNEIEWKPVKMPKKGQAGRALFVPYLTNRAVMKRLDEVFGKDGWENKFMPGPDGGVMCGIGCLIEGRLVWKFDGAENSDIEPVKGGFTGAMRRAAVQWGIGRYLYDAPRQWIQVDANGNLQGKPTLPKEMLPGGSVSHWANEDEFERMNGNGHNGNGGIANSQPPQGQQRPPQQRQRAPRPTPPPPDEPPAQRQPNGNLPKGVKPLGEAMGNILPPHFQQGPYPKLGPETENWVGFMPEGATRQPHARVTQNDYTKIKQRAEELGWEMNAVNALLHNTFKVNRFSALTYAQYCGVWHLLKYGSAWQEFTGMAFRQEQARKQARNQPA